jgi:CIC family chloride channel protein
VLAERFAADPGTALPVVDGAGDLRGIVLAIEVERALQDRADGVTAAVLARTVPVLRPDESLDAALSELTRNGGAGLPVGGGDGKVSSWLTHRDLLRAAAGIVATTH